MATCDDVILVIRNETDVEIKATQFEYTDEGRGETETIFGIDGSDRFDPGEEREYGPRNLGGIGNENTRFTVTYKRHSGNNWGPNLVHTTDTVNCDDNDRFTITLTE
jgi:hypothetical protein